MNKKTQSSIFILFCMVVILAVVYFFATPKSLRNVGIVSAPLYDSALNTKYISSADAWPPQVVFSDGEFLCNSGGKEIEADGIAVQKVIAGKTYCVITKSEGAAGSTYTTYTYITKIGDKLGGTTFVLRLVQCMNYPEPQQKECLDERSAFDPDTFADGLITHAQQK